MNKDILRTPNERFENLVDFPFKPNYYSYKGTRMHYVDEGDQEQQPILLLHGEPSWSYLYRKMIPGLRDEGFRTIAPDLIGFGKSDKFKKQKDYSYQYLVDSMQALIENLDLKNMTLFCQDWGSLVGLRLLEPLGERFDNVVLSNGGLPSASGWKGWIGHFLFKMRIKLAGKVTKEEFNRNPGFFNWVAYSQTTDYFPIGEIIQEGTVTKLDQDEIEGYEAPFPTDDYKAGARILPMLVTSQLRKNRQVWKDVLENWEKPFLTAFGDSDPITKGQHKRFIEKVPGAKNLDHPILKDGAHFIQEDKPDELVQLIVKINK